MFNKEGIEVVVRLLTQSGFVIQIDEVTGNGLRMRAANGKTYVNTLVSLNHEEVLKLIHVLQEAEKYIYENK